MVVPDTDFEERYVARSVVRSLGVSDDIIFAAEDANPQLDWQAIVYALDGVFLTYGGAMGQVLFLRERHVELSYKTPVEVLVEPGGPARLCKAARSFARKGEPTFA